MQVRILIQARVGSSRLPGKVLKPLAGRPLLARVVEQLSAARRHVDQPLELMVATTQDEGDDQTAALCRALKVPCFRGNRSNVLARYRAAVADMADEDVLIRATADNPLYCPRRTGLILERHLSAANDYTCVRNLSYVVPEVMGVGAFRRMAVMAEGAADAAYCREHVTPYFRSPDAPFYARQLPETWQGLRPDVRLTVDTPLEHERMDELLKLVADKPGTISLEDVYRAWDAWQLHSEACTTSAAA
jgi:spore coat polysaccharide biosynthesis protein SpsF